MRDGGFSDARLKQIGESLKPGSSAIIAVIDHVWVAEVERQMQKAGADYVTASLSADIAKQLEAGKDVAYTAVGTSEGTAVSRAAAGGDEAEVTTVVTTDQGTYAQNIQKKGDDVTAVAAVITDEGAAAVVATGKIAAEQPAPQAAASADAVAPAPAAPPAADSAPSEAAPAA
jgi:predicted  nucleic acid-binding Zn-ribbon protein